MSEMVQFRVALPPVCLGPNRSINWRVRSGAKKAYAETLWLAANEWKVQQHVEHNITPPWEKAEVHLAWHSIQRKDVDNAIAHCKSLIDGLSTKGQRPLGIFVDDKAITVTAEWVKAAKKGEERVEVTVTKR